MKQPTQPPGVISRIGKMQLPFFILSQCGGPYPTRKLDITQITIWEMVSPCMSAGRFLVSLTEVNNSQRILFLTSVIKEDINHHLYENKDLTESWQHFKKYISIFASQMQESCFSADSLEVSAIFIATHIKRYY